METRKRTAIVFAGAGALAILLAAVPVFGAPRAGAQERDDYHHREYRDNDRVELRGHVRSFSREGEGYRVYLDNDERSFWVPADRLEHPLRVGLAINFGGIFRGGLVRVDAVAWPDERGEFRADLRRDNERIERQGRVRSFARERDGYRVYLDNDDRSFWVPADRLSRPLSVGLSINLGGVFRGGRISVDAVNWPDERGYYGPVPGAIELRGIVERIDYRSNTLWLRSEGRVTRVDMRDRDLRDLHRGDRVSLGGRWMDDGDFRAFRIDQIR